MKLTEYKFSNTENMDIYYIDENREPMDIEILDSNLKILEEAIQDCQIVFAADLLESLFSFIDSTDFDKLDKEISNLRTELEEAYKDGDFVECGIIIRRILDITEDMLDD